jgi:hypothetical protein
MNKQVFHAIETSLHNLQYGSVEITVHAGKVIQVEKRERIRANLTQEGESSHNKSIHPTTGQPALDLKGST